MKFKVKTNAPLNADLVVRRSIEHWPSLGVYKDRPETHVYALRYSSGGVVATGTRAEIDAHIADKGYFRVK
ncbi:MAG: hypothetical protein ACF8MF_06715 [Phycisphaerales bacterium JB052]